MSKVVDNYFKVAVWHRVESDDRQSILQRVFPFSSGDSQGTKLALEQALAFYCKLPAADVHEAQLSVYRLCGCVMQSGQRAFEEIGKFS